MSLRAKVVSALGWTATGRIVGQIIAWAATLLVIRLLTPADYGLLAMAQIAVGLTGLLTEAGLSRALVQAPQVTRQLLREVFGFVLLVNVALAVVLAATAPLMAWFFNEPRLSSIIPAMSTVFVFGAFCTVPGAMLDRRLEFKRRAVLDVALTIVTSSTTLILAYQGFGVWALILSNISMAAWRMLGLQLIEPFWALPSLSMKGIMRHASFGFHIVATRVLWYVYSQADSFIIGKVLGKDLLGHYAVAMQLSSLPATKASGIINQIAFPAFAQVNNASEQGAAHLLMAARVLSLIAFPVFWGFSAVAPVLVPVLLGESWRSTTLAMQILPLVMPLRMITPVAYSAVQAVGRPDVSTKNMVIACCVMPFAFLIGSAWGLTGVCLAWLIVFPFLFLENMGRVLRVLNADVEALLRGMGRPVLAASIMYAAVTAVRAQTTLVGWTQLGILVSVGVVSYLAASFVVNRGGCTEAAAVIRP